MSNISDISPAARTTAAWRAAGERSDAEAAGRCLADGAVLISPLTARFQFQGRSQVQDVLIAAFQVISEIKYHTDVGDDLTRALVYRGRCGRQQLEEAQLLRFDTEGLITELTLFGRPLPGLRGTQPAAVHDEPHPPVLDVVAGSSTISSS